MGRLAAAAWLSLLAACSPTIPDGVFACAAESECPDGFHCVEGRCRRDVSDGDLDASDGSEAGNGDGDGDGGGNGDGDSTRDAAVDSSVAVDAGGEDAGVAVDAGSDA